MEKYQQQRFVRGKLAVSLMEKGRLQLIINSVFERKHEVYNLFDLSEKFDREYRFPMKWAISSTLSLVVAAGFAFGGIHLPFIGALFASGLCFSVSVASLVKFFHQRVEHVYIRNRRTGEVAFTLWVDPNDHDSLDSFLISLTEEIHGARVHPDATNETRLEAYKDALEFLLNEQVLSGEEAKGLYDRTKSRMTEKVPAKLYAIK